jgi:hypothetical protein
MRFKLIIISLLLLPAKEPPTLLAGIQEAFEFFQGPISTNEEARLLILRPSANDDFIVAIMSSPPKSIEKRFVQDIPAQG